MNSSLGEEGGRKMRAAEEELGKREREKERERERES
jgi:hypothetical protein